VSKQLISATLADFCIQYASYGDYKGAGTSPDSQPAKYASYGDYKGAGTDKASQPAKYASCKITS
jgi:hypothetical protein